MVLPLADYECSLCSKCGYCTFLAPSDIGILFVSVVPFFFLSF